MFDRYAKLKEHLSEVDGVTVNVGRGAQAMKNRVLLPAAKKRSWIDLCEEAIECF